IKAVLDRDAEISAGILVVLPEHLPEEHIAATALVLARPRPTNQYLHLCKWCQTYGHWDEDCNTPHAKCSSDKCIVPSSHPHAAGNCMFLSLRTDTPFLPSTDPYPNWPSPGYPTWEEDAEGDAIMEVQ